MNQITFLLLTALYLTLPILSIPFHPTLKTSETSTGKWIAGFGMTEFLSNRSNVEGHGTG